MVANNYIKYQGRCINKIYKAYNCHKMQNNNISHIVHIAIINNQQSYDSTEYKVYES